MSDRSMRAGDISQSVVVSGDGNTVALTFGASGVSLPLVRKQFPPPDRRRHQVAGERPRELDLLVPETGRLPFIGRLDLMAELQGWLDEDVDISVHALIGRAGSGKTRLAIALCQQIDSDPGGKSPWLAGFLSASELGAVVETMATHSFAWPRPTLLVIDYAAQCHQVLARWLDRLASQPLDGKLRLLLLDREAPEGFGWWHELAGSGPPARRDLFYSPQPRPLPDLADLEERGALIASALQAAHRLRPDAPAGPDIPAESADPAFDLRLSEPQFGNSLALVMAGVIALDRGPHSALALRHLEAARQLGQRELARMAALAESRRASGEAMRHLVAFNGLTGGIPVGDLRRIVADELAASRRSADLDAVSALLEQELPVRTEATDTPRSPRLTTIQPDLIGEAAIVEAFIGPASREAEAGSVVQRSYALSPQEGARALVRLVQDFGYPLEDADATEAERAAARRVIGWLRELMRESDSPEQLLPLANALPAETTLLRELTAELTQRLADHHRALAAANPDAFTPILAASLNNLAVRLSALGRREAALAVAEEAVQLRRALAAARPDAFTPDLARSLNNLGNSLSALGRREAALAAAEEAVEHYRALAAARPDAFTPDLAMSLNNLAASLSDLGRREAALGAAEEAVRHYRALAAARPDAFTPDLAMSLNNLANRLSALGRREAALAVAEEAVQLRRALAAARPDAFTPDLAGSLNNLATMLSDLGRREEALVMAEEAVRLRRALAAARPDAFTPDLAMSLNNLAASLSDLGRREAALRAAEEAVRHYRALAAARPDAFTPDLARSLWVLGDLYAENEEADLAVDMLAEAVRLLAPIFLAMPAAVAGMMGGMAQSYLTRCEAGGRAPDEELLGPIVAEFERLQGSGGQQ